MIRLVTFSSKKDCTINETPHGVLGSREIGESGAGWGKVQGAWSRGTNLGSREQKKKSREQAAGKIE